MNKAVHKGKMEYENLYGEGDNEDDEEIAKKFHIGRSDEKRSPHHPP
jgi:hypothetical protein